MPCYGPDGPPNIRSDIAETRVAELIEQVNAATRVACELSRYVDVKTLSKSSQKWLGEHFRLDEKRKKNRGL